MIKSFKDKEAEKIFHRQPSKKLAPDIQRTAKKKLNMLDATVSLGALNIPPGNRLEALKGNRADQFSIRINDQWRICFIWHDGDAYDMEIADYH
ncbi:MAG: type II toxin-antitoxin system RelE/ParE family toxin [Nitrospinae bacterium]|nr:type II toxin-antitoxin system RelE/ParE family toxin [Nitrospinota bacterium]